MLYMFKSDLSNLLAKSNKKAINMNSQWVYKALLIPHFKVRYDLKRWKFAMNPACPLYGTVDTINQDLILSSCHTARSQRRHRRRHDRELCQLALEVDERRKEHSAYVPFVKEGQSAQSAPGKIEDSETRTPGCTMLK